ncbi:hypothetical protein GCM10009854_10810 [Saccharopolyspora halophila]|uniref:DUF4231 domain-containing protein n=1 Tax=Saccharopolyspora halophila TaxID=405551 RepID=A0ABP5SQP9_9PSEU
MERVDTPGIVGGGVLAAEDRKQGDWERRIAERSEELYRARIVQRLLWTWAGPGNLLVVVLGVLLAALPVPLPVVLVMFAIAIVSAGVAAAFVYRQHFRVRAVDTELRALESAHREQLLDELATGDLLDAHKRYRAQLPELIERYRAEARRDRWKDQVLQTVVIGGSIIAATVTATATSIADVAFFAVGLSLLVALSAALAGYANYRDRSAAWQQIADALEREYESVELRVGRYRRFSEEREAYAEFAEAVEALRAERIGRLPSAVADRLAQ